MIRKAGEVWFPPANQQGEGCSKRPEPYPTQPKPAMSHGDPSRQLPLR